VLLKKKSVAKVPHSPAAFPGPLLRYVDPSVFSCGTFFSATAIWLGAIIRDFALSSDALWFAGTR